MWDNDLFVRLDPGDEIHASMQQVVKDAGRLAGVITSGIGRIKKVDMGYLAADGIYQRVFIHEAVELLSMQGNVAQLDDEPFSHIHVVVSDDDHIVRGGHLFSAIVEVTGEIHLRLLPEGEKYDHTLTRCHLEGSDFKPLSFSPQKGEN